VVSDVAHDVLRLVREERVILVQVLPKVVHFAPHHVDRVVCVFQVLVQRFQLTLMVKQV